MAEQNETLWAPWRLEYLMSLSSGAGSTGCFLCHAHQSPELDGQNHVIWRSGRTLTLLNKFPYANGHLLIAPAEHRGGLQDFAAETLAELSLRIRDAELALRTAVRADGFNVGLNIGHCAGAGLPDHIHWHVVPRWSGDSNFMTVTGGVRVIPQDLASVAQALREASAALGLPRS